MTKQTAFQIWARKEPNATTLLKIFAGNPKIFHGQPGIDLRQIRAVVKKNERTKQAVAKLEKQIIAKEGKFNSYLTPKRVDTIDDTVRLAKAFLRSKHPQVWQKYFGKK